MKIIDLFFPPVCPICKGYAGENVICDICDVRMKNLETPSEKYISIDGKPVIAYYLYNYGSKEFERYVFALKKQGNGNLFHHAAFLLESIVPENAIDEKTVVTEVPRRRRNVMEYGYDQSRKIAIVLANVLGIRYETLLVRKGFSKEQKNLDYHQRHQNVSGKFRALHKSEISKIMIVDDVLTTGNSFSECVRQIRSVYGNNVEIIGLFLAAKKQ